MGLKILILSLFFISTNVLAAVEIPLVYSAPLKKSNFSQVISASDIGASGSTSLSQVLTQTSQIQLLDFYGDGSRTSISMRGFGDNAAANSLVLLDGQPFVNPDTAGVDINSIPVDSIQQIEIIPGSASVLYGDQAVGGIIKITTKDPQKKVRNATVAYGSYTTKRAAVMLGDKLSNNFGYRVAATHYFSNNYRDHNQSQINDASALISYATDFSQINFSYNKYNQHLQLPCALTPEQAQQNPRQATSNLAHDNQDTDYFNLGFKHYFADWLLEINGNDRLMQGVGAYDSVPFTESRKTAEANVKLSGVITVRQYNFFPIIGGELLQGTYGFNSMFSRQRQLANYAQLEFPLLNQFKLIIGGRLAAAFYNLNNNGVIQTPENRAGANDIELLWETTPNLRFFVKRELSFRFPKVDEDTWTVDGQPLKTQVGTTYEVGATSNLNKATVQATIFRLNISNEIISIPDPVSNFNTFNENLDATTRNGAGLNVTFTPVTNVDINFGYNLINAKLAAGPDQGKAMPFVARNSLNLAADYHFANGINLYLSSVYTGWRYPLNDVANRLQPFGGFTIYNFCVSYQKPHYEVTLRVNNFTNKLYYGYVVATYQGANTSVAVYPSSGVNGLLSLAIRL